MKNPSATLPVKKLTNNKSVTVANNNTRKIYGGIYNQYFIPVDSIAQIECMYNPTVNARSENVKVRIEE